MLEENIQKLLEKRFEEEDLQDCFITEIRLNGGKLEVFVDSDEHISFDTCRVISRFIESILDEKLWLGESYTLDVSSPGATKPLVNIRQYPKHVGRKVEVKTVEGEKYIGKFSKFEHDTVYVTYTETRKEKKKKIREEVEQAIPFESIKSCRIKISF